jgi:hypothetical protein
VPRSIDLPILITSAIQPSASFTALQDAQARLQATEDSLRAWLQLGAHRVVICDGSGFSLDNRFQAAISGFRGIQIETLTFRNDAESVGKFGKGFGEGQIVAHALANSQLIKAASTFAKCTGKLWVENCHAVLANRSTPFLADATGGLFNPGMLDTRFYVSDVAFYRQWLLHSHERVRDQEGYFLEHAFMDDVRRSGLRGWISRPSMRIVGMSGSAGVFQKRSFLRSVTRDVRNQLLAFLL